MKRHAGPMDVVYAMVLASLVMWARWQEFNPKVLVIFICFLMTMEIVIHVRFRLNVVCTLCGFDPVLYKFNPEKAASQVKLRLEALKSDPDFLLSDRAHQIFKKLKTKSRSPRLDLDA